MGFRLQRLAMRLHYVDSLHLGATRVIGVSVLSSGADGGGELTVIDPGPAVVYPAVCAALTKLGLQPERVTRVFATHVHLDHSGGAWRWAEEHGARVYVHPEGATHLLDPARLVASASRIYGAEMNRLWGEIRAIAPEYVSVLQDGEPVALTDGVLVAYATPGHARHHHAYWLPTERWLFAGDVAGVAIGGGPVLPPCPPPDIDVPLWQASLERLSRLLPARVFLTHFGELPDPAHQLPELSRRLERWACWIRDRLCARMPQIDLVPAFARLTASELREGGADEAVSSVYERADPAAMSVAGLSRYWQKHRPEEVPSL